MFRYLFLLLIFPQIGGAQTVAIKETIPVTMDRFIGVDNFKNTYFLKDRVLNKLGKDGNFVYNALQLGRLTSVDIINPLKVVAFFQDTNTVVLLDNKLNEIERISFNNLRDFINVSAATNAGNNSLWVFNMDTQQLEIYNYRTNMQMVVSQPFPGKLLSQTSNLNYCFTLTPKKLRAFNVYGSLLNEIPNEGYEKIVQLNENLVALKENKLFYIPDFAKRNGEILQEAVKLELPEITIKDLQLTNEFLYIYDGKNLHTFTLTLPKKE
ncbi:hypothetical protein EI546_08090 [Aequorivita sp. H23M31]|uniref:6-bladed beta-propeller n=1 Tax=Aequorivita ciconiae TaxID=2494375 RepID=A0A410G343_9FLAO|nr:hypothetical protein [Aequorivita sp. H23M31]QAA81686.1 hypothetical protein EI546_08090 [Aequorivita sp. H23M31]